jgi:hypothetical protein
MAEQHKYVRQAETKILETAKELDLLIEILEIISDVGSRMFGNDRRNCPLDKAFREGIAQARNAVYNKAGETFRNAFTLMGCCTGTGELGELRKYARECLAKLFDEERRLHVLFFLQKYGRTAMFIDSDEEEAFRAEIKRKLGEDGGDK